ncbi:MAG: rhodanese-like domain-containing protein [Synechococcales cyanobacterium RM1_1_8]|nr:rhodanese-like domain-containing protein [Synechococcales cyanobacterium RM1_1_8]
MASLSSTQPYIVELSPKEFSDLPEPKHLLDVRSRLEYNLFHAPTAMQLNLLLIFMFRLPILGNWLMPRWLWELPRDESLGVICLTSHRSPLAAQQLARLGFTQIFNISGGMMAWKASNLSLQSGAEKQSIA